MNVGLAAFVIDDDVFHHRAAEFLATGAGVVNEDRNEIQRTMEDLTGSLGTPFAELVPGRAIDKWWRLKDRLGAIDRQLRPLVAGALLLATAFCPQFRKIDSF